MTKGGITAGLNHARKQVMTRAGCGSASERITLCRPQADGTRRRYPPRMHPHTVGRHLAAQEDCAPPALSCHCPSRIKQERQAPLRTKPRVHRHSPPPGGLLATCQSPTSYQKLEVTDGKESWRRHRRQKRKDTPSPTAATPRLACDHLRQHRGEQCRGAGRSEARCERPSSRPQPHAQSRAVDQHA